MTPPSPMAWLGQCPTKGFGPPRTGGLEQEDPEKQRKQGLRRGAGSVLGGERGCELRAPLGSAASEHGPGLGYWTHVFIWDRDNGAALAVLLRIRDAHETCAVVMLASHEGPGIGWRPGFLHWLVPRIPEAPQATPGLRPEPEQEVTLLRGLLCARNVPSAFQPRRPLQPHEDTGLIVPKITQLTRTWGQMSRPLLLAQQPPAAPSRMVLCASEQSPEVGGNWLRSWGAAGERGGRPSASVSQWATSH